MVAMRSRARQRTSLQPGVEGGSPGVKRGPGQADAGADPVLQPDGGTGRVGGPLRRPAGDVGRQPTGVDANAPAVEFRNVSKTFPGVNAVSDVTLSIARGEVHAIAGENGAGKSTLMNLLAQRARQTDGDIFICGQHVAFRGPRYAQAVGVSMVHQELALFAHLSVADNLCIGREPGAVVLRRSRELQHARGLLEQVGLNVDPRRLVSALSVADQQLVEIAKALAVDAKVVIMDEPTASLSGEEIGVLFDVVERLRAAGIAVLYVTHRLEEVFRLADRVTVMRDGRLVTTAATSMLDENELVRLMVGRELTNLYSKPNVTLGRVVLSVRNLSRRGVLQDCSFSVRAGEILGLAGIVGAGRSELARAVFGAEPPDAGQIELDGRPIRPRSPAEAMREGVTYVTEDRKRDGVMLNRTVAENITLARPPGRFGTLNLRREAQIATGRVDELRIRTTSIRRILSVLSGGSQQKVLVARGLETNAPVMIFDEPGRGIDIGAKAEIFALIGRLAEQGKAIVMISSYLPELINMCDRILVMKDGCMAGELGRDEFSEERIARLATKGRWAS
jgi:ribose transport system ATP-binding protein